MLFEQKALDASFTDEHPIGAGDRADRDPPVRDRETLREAVARIIEIPSDTLAADEPLTAVGLDSSSAAPRGALAANVGHRDDELGAAERADDSRSGGQAAFDGGAGADFARGGAAIRLGPPARTSPASYDQERLWVTRQLASDRAALEHRARIANPRPLRSAAVRSVHARDCQPARRR